MSDLTRRDFLEKTATAALGAMIVPRWVLGGKGYTPPSRKLDVAFVGIGGMGMENMAQMLDENIVAVCDVDYAYVERSLANRLRPPQGMTDPRPEAVRLRDAYTKARKYTDFRKMLEREKTIDGVVIATPDHTHAAVAVAAMRAGKHVYVQKPLTYSVYEARLLSRVARETKRVTQMGNQGHSMEGTRRIVEIVGSGVLGPIREVHVWTDRPYRYWAQGIPRPLPPQAAPATATTAQTQQQAAQQQISAQSPPGSPLPAPGIPAILPPAPPRWNGATVERAVQKVLAENPQTIPEGLDWNLFLGPAREIPYHPVYHPFSWRGWVDFGTASLGDMGAHLIDQPYWALGLTQPTSITASGTPWAGPATDRGTYPIAMTAHYEFPARGDRPAVKLHWYDGGLLPERPKFYPDELPLQGGGGGIFVGEKGILVYETYGNNPRVFPEDVAAQAAAVPQSVARITVPHEVNFAQACKGEATASAPFEYASALTETMLLGIVALRSGQGRRILYDAGAMRVTNVPEANAFLTREYRKGWEL
ncbi:MAG TPA: Gfo/Idh/MocA family oxidoreductase [Gemmatimonadaceae bacterium]|nr:Gfo/Idh/MocA family oxidoreductase [Gemmatimonadaceae bacterium]